MNKAEQLHRAHLFRKMHDRSGILVLPNAWDAASARIFERAGFSAIATTSGGIAWSLGYADGERISRDEVVAATERIARAVDVPVTADIESGYGANAAEVAETVRAIIGAGAIGINLEDSLPSGALRDAAAAAERIRTARDAAAGAGIPIVINARTDAWLHGFGANDSERFDETIRRAKMYLAAGADCIYPIGLGDRATFAALVKELDAPINVGARPGLPDVAELARIGIARVSTATRFATLTLSALDRAARALHDDGRFDGLCATLTHPDVQHLFDRT